MEEIITDIHNIESDIDKVDDKCQKISCSPIMDALKECLNLVVDCFKCIFHTCLFCKKKD
jgi:hypothetical protein